MTEARQNTELPRAVKWGRRLIRWGLAALVLGGAALKQLAPARQGKGLDPATLTILIPIWGACLVGTILSLWGWVRYPCLEIELDLEEFPQRRDGRLFGSFTKALACFTLFLAWLATSLTFANPDEVIPMWTRIVGGYCSTAYCWFLIYLAALYSPARHLATTTYLNSFGPLIGVLLVPLTWFLLVGLNVGQVEQTAFPVGLTERAANKIKRTLRESPPWRGRTYVRLQIEEGELRGFRFERVADSAFDLVGASYGLTLVISRKDVERAAGYVIDFQTVGDDGSFYVKDPDASHSRASNPGGVRLSEDKLRHLHPELFPMPRRLWASSSERTSNEGLAGRRELIAEHLRNGDSRAAIVVSTHPLIVAAYTDELDCVALLRFARQLAFAYGLKLGSRLLTINTYSSQGECPEDILPGPGDTGNFINFQPIIADFLSDDMEQVETHKSCITEEEWERAAEFGRQMLARGIRPRDGSPLRSGQPT